jgi:hypothetical protein
MNTIKPEVISHSNRGLIPKKTVREILGIKARVTFIKDCQVLGLTDAHYTWGEIKQLLALRLFLIKGKSGIFSRRLYSELLKENTPKVIIANLGIDLEKELQELQNQWIYKI